MTQCLAAATAAVASAIATAVAVTAAIRLAAANTPRITGATARGILSTLAVAANDVGFNLIVARLGCAVTAAKKAVQTIAKMTHINPTIPRFRQGDLSLPALSYAG
ncbi:MAG: hypothetical protein IJC88_06025 [Oscillospiraceae bacterium]|nr:hypothetical protein [Oscillospiraceae bacterium]